MFWAPHFRNYIGSHIGCKKNWAAYTTFNQKPGLGGSVVRRGSITFCPDWWKHKRRKDSLLAWRRGEKTIAEGTKMAPAYSTPAILLHEIAHLVTKHGWCTLPLHYPSFNIY